MPFCSLNLSSQLNPQNSRERSRNARAFCKEFLQQKNKEFPRGAWRRRRSGQLETLPKQHTQGSPEASSKPRLWREHFPPTASGLLLQETTPRSESCTVTTCAACKHTAKVFDHNQKRSKPKVRGVIVEVFPPPITNYYDNNSLWIFLRNSEGAL